MTVTLARVRKGIESTFSVCGEKVEIKSGAYDATQMYVDGELVAQFDRGMGEWVLQNRPPKDGLIVHYTSLTILA